ncbi:hypothetical protein DYB25_011699 [Aphanomyces astaci]|uniref:Uncharacterized protein n=1 Tax=Aphanomyces astaci TaxID=112090 RepID=A0A397EJ39_APHAT|nr:hypothetical protein DYB25_011699 [Aphanomyces astaci]RHY42373.1 hypothetical protein DYB38_012439 [Aphanomyces astaci]RHY61773.1 hypothetical protein DYB30_012311 [Aphanomyces astaci]RHY79188.1 hypothetical protein DYB31_004497 [Aphanomyces astaci]RQM10150.1 hypothetical protein B5M09_008069 [Aphanomyces astaci]
MDDNVRGGDADATSTERVLKRKVKNSRTNLFEWVKYRCHLGDGFFLCECPTSFDNETVSLQVLLANILSVHPKAASRFEITHATPSGHSSDEFMAPTSQHCSLWAEEQLGILVRVEGVLKQLETENKLYLQRETQLRHELANLQDSMRLMDVERQELLTQLRDVTTEREEWKAMARRKQADMTQLRDDLQLARDEIRLLTNEQLRLHHRNKDLAVHVQRLDTLVYGKF